ncbi:hypothetical protein Q8A73_019538 [Channa argus]|nr:hypothetical protein Q8A73_019538 [Channa argus]
MTTLRRKSEFLFFLDGIRSVKAEKEQHQLSPCEECMQVLLQMKMTSAVTSPHFAMAALFRLASLDKAQCVFDRGFGIPTPNICSCRWTPTVVRHFAEQVSLQPPSIIPLLFCFFNLA